MEYIPGSLQEIQLKTKGQKQHSTTVTSPTSIMQLIANMKQIVAENSALLGRYGSFFFAADARGVKLVTKQSFQDKNPPALSDIFQDFDDLDWPHMLDRSKGKLYLDLGISIHNKGTIPLVGLWQLNKLHDFSALMGIKTGQVHHFGTLGFYGG